MSRQSEITAVIQSIAADIKWLLKKTIIISLTGNFTTGSTSPVPVTNFKLPLKANKKYLIKLHGAVRSSSGLAGAGICLIVSGNPLSISGRCFIQHDRRAADCIVQFENAQCESTSWLEDNNKDNHISGEWLVSTVAAGDCYIGLRCSSTLYNCTLMANKTVMIIEELRT